MTYNDIQLKLQDLFNRLNSVATKLAESKRCLAELDKRLKEHYESLEDASNAAAYVKNKDVVSMEAFVYTSNREEALLAVIDEAKVKRDSLFCQIGLLDKERKKILWVYEQTEKLLKDSLNNIVPIR